MDLVEVTSHRAARSRADLALAAGETPVAGGTWLFSEPQPGTTGLVDLTTLGWAPWERTGTGLHLGATCTIEELLGVPEDVLGSAAALVRSCADAFLMSFKVQHLATVGGNLCLALPAGAMISLFTALGATARIWGDGTSERSVPVADLVTGVRATVLAPGEVLRSVEVPAAALTATYAFRRTSLAPLGRSSVVVVARRTPAGVTVSLTAATTRPVVLELEGELEGEPGGDAGEPPDRLEAGLAAVDCWYADAHGAPDWRAAMARRLAREAVAEVLAG